MYPFNWAVITSYQKSHLFTLYFLSRPQFPSFLPELILSLVKTTTNIPENIGTTDVCVKFSHQFLKPFQIIAQSMVPSKFNMTSIIAGRHWKYFMCMNNQCACLLSMLYVQLVILHFHTELCDIAGGYKAAVHHICCMSRDTATDYLILLHLQPHLMLTMIQ